MNIFISMTIGSWKIIRKIVERDDVTIVLVKSSNMDGLWVMKIKENMKTVESTLYDKYVRGCQYGLQIPEQLVYKRSLINRLCGSIPYNEMGNIDWHGKLTDNAYWYVMEQFYNNITTSLVTAKLNMRLFLKECIGFIKYIHMQGLVYGDMKVSNILYNKDPARFCICDYEFIRPPKMKLVQEKRLPVAYYYLYLGIPSDKPYFSYRADLTAFGYILWSIILSDRNYDTRFAWQEKAIYYYDRDSKLEVGLVPKFKLLDDMRNSILDTMPGIMKQYFAIVDKIDWFQTAAPDEGIYEELLTIENMDAV